MSDTPPAESCTCLVSSPAFRPIGFRAAAASRWFVLVTGYQAERSVERAVRALGMPTWLGKHEDAEHRIRLLFPRYLLFQADLASNDRWRELYRQPGVEMVLGTRGERPTPLRIGSLDGLFNMCSSDGVIYQDRPVQRFDRIAPGAIVQLKAGRFAGWEGVCRWSNGKRVAVLLSILGREVAVQVPRADIVAA